MRNKTIIAYICVIFVCIVSSGYLMSKDLSIPSEPITTRTTSIISTPVTTRTTSIISTPRTTTTTRLNKLYKSRNIKKLRYQSFNSLGKTVETTRSYLKAGKEKQCIDVIYTLLIREKLITIEQFDDVMNELHPGN